MPTYFAMVNMLANIEKKTVFTLFDSYTTMSIL